MTRRPARFALAIASAALMCASAGADETAAQSEVEAAAHQFPLGLRTRAWLERQRSGAEASAQGHGLVPPAERRARLRYLESFEHPIPDLFDLDEVEDR